MLRAYSQVEVVPHPAVATRGQRPWQRVNRASLQMLVGFYQWEW